MFYAQTVNLVRMSLLSKVVRCMRTIAPLELAETSWDNVGVLVGKTCPPDRGRLETIASHSACRRASVPVASVQQGLPDDRPDPSSPRRSAIRPKGKKHKVLSNGCFKQVFCQVGTIVAYHPPIFRPMKRLTQSDVKQDIVMKAIARGVGIYSPHTACDNCVDGGINVISDRHSSCADAWT